MYDLVYPLSRELVSHGPISFHQHYICILTFGYAYTSPYFWLVLPDEQFGFIDGIDRDKKR
jgi:hypothetical protein